MELAAEIASVTKSQEIARRLGRAQMARDVLAFCRMESLLPISADAKIVGIIELCKQEATK